MFTLFLPKATRDKKSRSLYRLLEEREQTQTERDELRVCTLAVYSAVDAFILLPLKWDIIHFLSQEHAVLIKCVQYVNCTTIW